MGACACFFVTSNDPVRLLPQFWSFAMIFTTEGHKSFSVDQLWNLIQAGLEQINKSTLLFFTSTEKIQEDV
jgi:hypothetical protein